MSRALFIGRFQPFHNGHLAVIENALEEVDQVIICIGSGNCEPDTKNPLKGYERAEMIEETLKDEGILDEFFKVMMVDDYDSHSLWRQAVLEKCPQFEWLYSEEKMYNVLGGNIKFVNISERIDGISGTEIRQMIANNGNSWKEKVPQKVTDYIIKNKIDERIKELNY